VLDGSIVLALRDCIEGLREAWRISEFPVILCGTTAEAGKLSTAAQALFKHEISFEVSEPFLSLIDLRFMQNTVGPQ
jgi:peroxin-6